VHGGTWATICNLRMGTFPVSRRKLQSGEWSLIEADHDVRCEYIPAITTRIFRILSN
jgi:hypothetical protein